MKPLFCTHCLSDKITEYDVFGVSRCFACGLSFTREDEKRAIFHKIWSTCKDTDKKLWQRFAELFHLNVPSDWL